MISTLRLAAVALALVVAGCNSNSTNKIVGRWRADITDAPIGPNGAAEVVWEFTEDGTFTVFRVVPGRPPPNADKVSAGRYLLSTGDSVTLTNLDPPLGGKTKATERIVIDGDTMIVGGRGKDPTYRFTRLQE
ncbi:MAG TPA: hypothetical protein VD866_09955 [Urbifossiella sp.]|nr:hypothetical protein [Urbifossiella sp.]